jgi:hypothetical protein
MDNEVDIEPERIGLYFLEECVDDMWQAHALLRTTAPSGSEATVTVTIEEEPTQEACRVRMAERWPYSREASKEEFYRAFWKGEKPPRGAQGTGKRMMARAIRGGERTVASFGTVPRVPAGRKVKEVKARVLNKADLPDDITDETLVAPVQAAKYIGVPPQYVYNKIYHGKLKAVGERPKMVRWGDVRRMFGA